MTGTHGYRWRVVIATVATMTAALVVLGTASVIVAHRELHANAHRQAVEETRAVMAVADDRLRATGPDRVAELNTLLRDIGEFTVLAVVDGEEVRTDARFGLADVPTTLRTPGADTTTTVVDMAGGEFLVTATQSQPGLDYFLFFPLDRLNRDVALLQRIVAGTAVTAVIAMLVGTLVASRRVLRPVDDTAEAARQLARGVLGTRVSVPSGSFVDLGDAFNDMATALQEMVERLAAMEARQRQFVADVSHELRTPLTALATASELFEPAIEDLPPGPRRRAAETLVTEIRRLRQTVLDLMEISRLDAGMSNVEPEPVSVGRMLGQLVAHHPDGAHVRLRVEGEPLAMADTRRLHTIMRNLVDNAMEHAAPPVEVATRTVGDRVEIEVVDHGPGVPDAARDDIFERFFKVDASRSRTRGSGLGLSIIRDHARQLGGDVILQGQRPHEGACFLVILPAAESMDTSRPEATDSPSRT